MNTFVRKYVQIITNEKKDSESWLIFLLPFANLESRKMPLDLMLIVIMIHILIYTFIYVREQIKPSSSFYSAKEVRALMFLEAEVNFQMILS